MTTSASLATRRDERFALRHGTAFIDFPSGRLGHGRSIAVLTHVSAAGVQCTIDGPDPAFATDEHIDAVTMRIGDCRIQGDLVIKNARRSGADTTEIGCLFAPAAGVDEDRFMMLLVGLDAHDVAGADTP